MKKYTQLVRSRLQKAPKKLLCSLAAAAVVVTTLVTANPIAVRADERNPEINPKFTIQHYLKFPAVDMDLKTNLTDGTVLNVLDRLPSSVNGLSHINSASNNAILESGREAPYVQEIAVQRPDFC